MGRLESRRMSRVSPFRQRQDEQRPEGRETTECSATMGSFHGRELEIRLGPDHAMEGKSWNE